MTNTTNEHTEDTTTTCSELKSGTVTTMALDGLLVGAVLGVTVGEAVEGWAVVGLAVGTLVGCGDG